MLALLMFIVIVTGFNLVPQLTKKRFPKTEKAVTRILTIISLTFLVLSILLHYGYSLKGLYSNSIIGVVFILISLIYFVIVKNTWNKLYTILLLTPLIMVSLYNLVFIKKISEYRINNEYRIEAIIGGFLSCGENIKITKSALLIFDKEVFYDYGICLRGIEKIVTVEFNEKRAEFLIYHDGERNPENPFRYQIENINEW
ncbi:MAG: hypothetical protein IPH20_04390 [Bacteroidales bacterium]|nr:hypothetical protein [Bacteroidales bacterium]